MNRIRRAAPADVSRIAEIIVVNYRQNFFPFFQNEEYYFSELNVLDTAKEFPEEVLCNTYVYDDGVVKGMMRVSGDELVKLFIEPQFQSQGIGAALLQYALHELHVTWLWVLEYNKRGIAFYKRHGLQMTGVRMIEDECVPLWKMALRSDLCLKKLSADTPDKEALDRINAVSFAAEQQTSIDDLFRSDRGDLDILGIYHAGELIGFFSVRRYKSLAYPGYFAIAPAHRSKGFGSRALNLLKDYYGGMQIVIEIESVYEDCNNPEQRRSRRDFYLRNGMLTTGWFLYYDDTELELICSEPEFRKQEFEELTQKIHALYYDSIPALYQKQADPDSAERT